ncbi:HAMP domain-containing histidine kinase [Spirosoma taeanense]|uniref:histidine kinase n=1 Tax=Spirosoma taeanense TaxID=2735870 RepID=A0A6M5Y6J5_9BACT|nr:HAMP domain-containing sensor histidine kinase [Spirosoma taeanense]QJW88673.1 HAMP domain-containing histidine kinase [Spirosoma taeanense]
MSLLRKTLLYLFLVSVPVVIGGGWLFHLLIYRGIQYEIDEQLSSDLAYVRQQLAQGHQFAGRFPLDNPRVEPVGFGRLIGPVFTDTLAFDWRENQRIPVRQLVSTEVVRGKTYRITVRQAMGELNEIAHFLSLVVTGGFIILLGLLVLLNGWVSRRLWQPFYRLTNRLREYRLDENTPTVFPDSVIAEFSAVSAALNAMSRNLYQQFRVQKEFTDHAAHEMQTPLALVTAQLDSLLGTEPLTSEQVELMESAQNSVRRLVNLNKSLLLLTKIDNRQFAEQQRVDLSDLVESLYRQFIPLADYRKMTWQRQVSPGVQKTLNPYLAEVLVTNLLKNAILHADTSTGSTIILTPTHLKTRNAGPPLPFPADQLFGRFVKNPARPNSTGLGLALVKQIADRYGIIVSYAYDSLTRVHEFTLSLPAS